MRLRLMPLNKILAALYHPFRAASICGCGEIGRHVRFRSRYVIGIIRQQFYCAKLTKFNIADVVKLADTLDLGSNTERCAGSSPVIRTKFLAEVDSCYSYRSFSITII